MFCINCGSRLIEGARFCHMCGQKVALPWQGTAGNAAVPAAGRAYTLVCPPEKYRLNPYNYNTSIAAQQMVTRRALGSEFYMDDFSDYCMSEKTATTYDYMATLLSMFFSNYNIYTNIPYSVMFPERSAEFLKPGVNVDFVLSMKGRPLLAIQLPDPSDYMFKAPSYTWKALEAYGLPALRFFLGWSNELNYSVDRIDSCLSGRI